MQNSDVAPSQALMPPRSSLLAWAVCLVASLFFFYEFVQMMMFNAIDQGLMASLNITATDIGKISSAYFIANVLFMFPAGILLDRFSTRKIIISAMILCIIGTLCFSFSSNIYFSMFARFLTGIGGSFPFLCCLRLISRWFPPRRWALLSGVMVTMAFLGGAAGQTPLTYIVSWVGWRHALQIDAVMGVFFTGIIFLVVQDCPEGYTEIIKQKAKELNIYQAVRSTLFNAQNWFYGLYTSMLNLSVMILGVYGSLYITQMRGFTEKQSSYITTMIFFGTMVGSPMIGWLSDRMGLRKMPMIVFAILSLFVLLAIVYLPNLSFVELIVLFFLLGFMTSAQIISYPAISESNSHDMAGSALGFASVLIMGAPAIFQPLFGWFLDLHWSGKLVGKVPVYTPSNFHDAMLILPITCVIGLVLAMLAKETYCHGHKG